MIKIKPLEEIKKEVNKLYTIESISYEIRKIKKNIEENNIDNTYGESIIILLQQRAREIADAKIKGYKAMEEKIKNEKC